MANYYNSPKNYLELETYKSYQGKSPLSVHFPLNLPFSNALVYQDCAFNVFSLPVPPDMNHREITCEAVREAIMVQMVSFLFDDPALIPDFRQTVWERAEGGYPIAHGSLFTWRKEYTLVSCMDPFSGAVYLKVSVTNHSDFEQKAVVRSFQSETRENTFMDYHYYPFRWDAEKWSKLVKANVVPAVIDAGKFNVENDDSFTFEDSDYNKRFGCSQPYAVAPGMRVKNGSGFTKYSCDLQPGETASFTIAVFFDGSDPAFPAAEFDTVCERSRNYWDSFLNAGFCYYGTRKETDIFRALQWCSLQLLLNLESPVHGNVFQPCQGGTSERFYVWVWEAMCCYRPMLKLGHFEQVRKVIEFMFKLQDGGCPPEGKFQSLEGAIGTTGPRWANATGSALVLASEYAELSGDREFLETYLPKMQRAARWILNEVKATQLYDSDGSKKLGFGVLPMCCASDGDYGYIIVSSDLWSLAGVETFAQLLKSRNDPSYPSIAAEAADYRKNLSDAIDSVRKENGFIDRKLSEEGRIAKVFYVCEGAIKLLNTFGDPREERFRKFIAYSEENLFSERFCGPLFDRINYVGNCEANLFTSYLKLGEWKKAHLAAAAFRRCGMTQDLYLTQERFSEVDDSYTPWQPNASNNGRYLQMILESLYLECPDNEFILCGGVPPQALLRGERFSIEKLYTSGGIVSLILESGTLTVSRTIPFSAGTRFRLPDYIKFQCSILKELPGNIFEITEPLRAFSGTAEADLQKISE